MEATRYWVGVTIVAFGPVSIVFWFSVHPFIALWRRVGAKTTLAIHITAMVLIGGTLMSFHAVLMRGDLGTGWRDQDGEMASRKPMNGRRAPGSPPPRVAARTFRSGSEYDPPRMIQRASSPTSLPVSAGSKGYG